MKLCTRQPVEGLERLLTRSVQLSVNVGYYTIQLSGCQWKNLFWF